MLTDITDAFKKTLVKVWQVAGLLLVLDVMSGLRYAWGIFFRNPSRACLVQIPAPNQAPLRLCALPHHFHDIYTVSKMQEVSTDK